MTQDKRQHIRLATGRVFYGRELADHLNGKRKPLLRRLRRWYTRNWKLCWYWTAVVAGCLGAAWGIVG